MNTNFNFTDGLMIVFLSTGLQLGCVVDNPGADAGMDSANDTSIVSAMLDAGMEDRDAGQTVDAGRTDIADQMIPHDVSIPPLDASPPEPDLAIDQTIPVDMWTPPEPVQCNVNIEFDAPIEESFHHQTSAFDISGLITNSAGEPIANVSVNLIEGNATPITTIQTNDAGRFMFSSESLPQRSGQRYIRAEPTIDGQPCLEQAALTLFICRNLIDEDFTTLPDEWSLYRDATWDANGWLEMTGTAQGRKGAVFNTVDAISSGVASIQFTLTTGGGRNGGADGIAFTVVEVPSADQLRTLLDGASTGGGLGYGVGGGYADSDFTLNGDALTVEIDTWFNRQNNTTERHTDPTSVNHIAITQNADPGDHIAWFEVPNVEDLQPHTVRVDLTGDLMRITYDGQIVIEQPVNFTFKVATCSSRAQPGGQRTIIVSMIFKFSTTANKWA